MPFLYLLGVVLFFSQNVLSHHLVQNDEYNLIMDELSIWLDNNYQFQKKNIKHPGIKFLSNKQLCEMAKIKYDDSDREYDCEKTNIIIFGLYNYEKKHIYLNKLVDLKTKRGKAVLLHQLVHHYQYECGQNLDISCRGDIEKVADDLEIKYMHSEY